MKIVTLILFLFSSSLMAKGFSKNPILKCSELVGKDFAKELGEKVVINSANEVLDSSINKSYCDVSGKISPEISFEVKLPVTNWTGRFVQIGCGGYCGNLNLKPLDNVATCTPALNGEVVLAATDMGHSGGMGDATWGSDSQKRIDFAHRANHLTAVMSKILINAFYGNKVQYSYFMGCSDGGREALKELQKYPEDFDGVTAGAAAMNLTAHNTLYHAWNYVSNTDDNNKTILLAAKTTLLHNAVLKACDAKDGVSDGVINVPWECQFDVESLLCKDSSDTKNCLTEAEVKVVKAIYNGPVDPNTNNKLTIGRPLFGSELQWKGFAPEKADQSLFPFSVAMQTFQSVVNTEPVAKDFSLKNIIFNEETFDQVTKLHDLYDANSTNIDTFKAKGGKLILWHGINDTDMAPISTVAYYHALEKKYGRNDLQKFSKLYLLPGVGHCGGGQGPSNLELLTAIMNWVENKKAPYQLIATLTSGGDRQGPPPSGQMPPGGMPPAMKLKNEPKKVIRTRPVYPYPITTVYKGMGSTDDAASFTAGKKVPVPEELLEWYGSKFYK